MRERIGDRLPKFSDEDKNVLKNSADFVGVNHYTSRLIAHVTTNPEHHDFYQAQEIERIVELPGGEIISERAASEWLYIVPWGLRKLLNYIAQKYHNPPIYITENGMDDEDDPTAQLHEVLDDKKRVGYFKGYLAAVAQAIRVIKRSPLSPMAASSNPDTFAGVCHLASEFDEHLMIYKDGDEVVYVPDRFIALYAKLKLKYGTLLPHPDVYSDPKFRSQALLGILNLVYEIIHTKKNEFNRTLFESWMESAKSLQNLGIDISWLTENLELLQQVLVIRERKENAIRERDEIVATLTEVEEELVRLNVEKQKIMCEVKDFEANLLRIDKEIQQAKNEKEVNMQICKEYYDMADKHKLNVSVLDGLL